MSPEFKGMNLTLNSKLQTPNLLQVPLGELVDIKIVKGPTQIKSEEGLLTAYVYIDFTGRDIGGYVNEAKQKVASMKIPEGYRLEWSGEYEHLVKTHERLKLVIPLTALIIFVLIYLNTKSVTKTFIVLLAVPFSLVGSFWLLYFLNYNMSIAVWVGIIALAGLDAETGVVMLLYLELAYERWKKEGKLNSIADLKEAVMYGAVKRIRPEDNDCKRDTCGTYPDNVQPRNRRRRHETHCSSYGGRSYHFNNSGTGYLSRHLYAVEGKRI